MDSTKLRHKGSVADQPKKETPKVKGISLEDLSPGKLKSLRRIYKCATVPEKMKKATRLGVDFAEYVKYKLLL
jgi:hypothetical protein